MTDAKAMDQLNADLNDVLNRMDVAQQRLKVETKQMDGPVSGTDLREYQSQLLLKLREIRDAMQMEGLSLEQLRKERDEARTECDALTKQVAKLQYRVHHLQQHVRVTSTASMKP